MTKEERTFLIQFISRSDLNDELIKLETQILDFFVNFATSEIENKKEKTPQEFLNLEENFLKYSELVKYQYFNYGMLAQSLEENYSLSFTPQNLKEVLPIDNY